MSDTLKEALRRVNQAHFDLQELPAIKWSRGRIKPRYRRLTLGLYDITRNEVRVHPLFREKPIPEFVLDYIIFHELLHYQDRRELRRNRWFRGRRKVHDKAFHDREKSYPRHHEAALYIKSMLKGHFPSEKEERHEA